MKTTFLLLALVVLLPLTAQDRRYEIVIERTRGTRGSLELRVGGRSVHRCLCWEASVGRVAARVVPGCSATTIGQTRRPGISLPAERIGRKGIFIKGGSQAAISPGPILVPVDDLRLLHAAIVEKDARNVTVRIRSAEVAETIAGLRQLLAGAERDPELAREATVLRNLIRVVDVAHDAGAAERLVGKNAFFKSLRDEELEAAMKPGPRAAIRWLAAGARRASMGFAASLVDPAWPAQLAEDPAEVLQERRSGRDDVARAGARLLTIPRTPRNAGNQDALFRLLLHRLGHGVPVPKGFAVR